MHFARFIRNVPLRANDGVRTKSVINVILQTVDDTVEHRVNQKDCPYVKPSSERCATPKVVTQTMLITSESSQYAMG